MQTLRKNRETKKNIERKTPPCLIQRKEETVKEKEKKEKRKKNRDGGSAGRRVEFICMVQRRNAKDKYTAFIDAKQLDLFTGEERCQGTIKGGSPDRASSRYSLWHRLVINQSANHP